MALQFEWDAEKAAENLKTHGITFEEALTVFADPLSSTIPDPDHSVGEKRFLMVGRSVQGQTLVFSHTEQGERIRIISGRDVHGGRAYV